MEVGRWRVGQVVRRWCVGQGGVETYVSDMMMGGWVILCLGIPVSTCMGTKWWGYFLYLNSPASTWVQSAAIITLLNGGFPPKIHWSHANL